MTLKLTYKELSDITYDNWVDDRFEIVYNDIPRDGHSSNYIEDDGRQLRYFEFKDTLTGIIYDFSYIFHHDWTTEFPLAFLGDPPKGIEFVKESVLIEPPKPIVEPEPELTPEQIADKELWTRYIENEAKYKIVQPKEKINIPSKEIKDVKEFLKTKKFNMYELRAKIIPLCIKYELEQKSFWRWIQNKK